MGHRADAEDSPVPNPKPRAGSPTDGREEGRRTSVVDRRLMPDRRAVEADEVTGLERRRRAGRRRSDFTKAAEEGEMTKEQFLFLMAIDAFKRANSRQYPTWTDVLEVVRLLGYRKTVKSELTLPNAEDWQESPEAPAGVRTERQMERDALARKLDAPRQKAA